MNGNTELPFRWKRWAGAMMISALPAAFVILLGVVWIGGIEVFQPHLKTFFVILVLLCLLGLVVFATAMSLMLPRLFRQELRWAVNQNEMRLLEQETKRASFLADFFHELRTPLTSILGFAALAKKNLKDPGMLLERDDLNLCRCWEKTIKNINMVERGGWRLSSLVVDMQDLQRMEFGNMPWHDAEVMVFELVEETVATVKQGMELPPQINLRTFIPEELSMIRVDRERIIQVLSNLISCSLACIQSGTVDVVFRMERDSPRFEVRSTGGSTTARELEMCFQGFHKISCNGAQGESGLGLFISKRIIDHYGGRIWAESESDKSCSLIFTMPPAVVVKGSHGG